MTVLVLPGLGGSGEGHWQRWWLKQDFRARLVEQADWDRPELETWLAVLVQAVEAHPGAVLVAHSLACSLVAHLAARAPHLPIRGALLVAPADVEDRTRTPGSVASFAPLPYDPLPFPAIVVGSSDDPFVSIGRAMLFAHAWEARFVHLRDGGHINVASGFGRWPDGLRLARQLAGSRQASPRPFQLVQNCAAAGLV